MNPAIDQFILEIVEGLHSAKDFAVGQLPDIAIQAIRYRIAVNTFAILFCSLAVYGCYRVYQYGHKEADGDYLSDGEFLKIFSIMIGICFLVVIPFFVPSLLQAIVTPKLYLLEYAANLVRK